MNKCKTCKWWSRDYEGGAGGYCDKSVRVVFDGPDEDFGCVMWEQK